MTLDLDLPTTLAIAFLVLLAGRFCNRRIALLDRYNIPDPITGGILASMAGLVLHQSFAIDLSYDMTLRNPAMLAFFTTIGLGASLRTLVAGGRSLIVFLIVVALFLVVQNAVGIGLAEVFDLNPLVGLIGGSVTLSGGHATGAAYAAPFAAVQNLQGAVALALTAATFGLIAGGIIGAPVARFLIVRYGLSSNATGANSLAARAPAAAPVQPVGADDILETLFAITLCMVGGAYLARWLASESLTIPGFLWSLLIGVVIRNLSELFGFARLNQASIDLLGSVFLSLFLALTMMSLRLWELASLAGPLLAILAVQVAIMIAYACLVTYRVMGRVTGRGYDAAVLAAGHCGFGLGSTATAIANIQALTRRFGPSPQSFVIIPLTGAFFIDLINALVITFYLRLPLFGFGG